MLIKTYPNNVEKESINDGYISKWAIIVRTLANLGIGLLPLSMVTAAYFVLG